MFDIEKIFEIVCGINAISNYAYDIHYSAKGKFFYSDHLFAERIGDTEEMEDEKDDLIETIYLGRGIEAPLSSDIAERVAELTPAVTDDIQLNFKMLRDMIVKVLIDIETLDDLTRGEEDLLGTIAHVLQRHNGLLFNQLFYTREELALNNDKWITVKPHGEDEKGRHLFLKSGETPKQAMKRQWGVDLDKEKKGKLEPKDKPKDDNKRDDSPKIDKSSEDISKLSDDDLWQKTRELRARETQLLLSVFDKIKNSPKYKELDNKYIEAENAYYKTPHDEYEKKAKLSREIDEAREARDKFYFEQEKKINEQNKAEIDEIRKLVEEYSKEAAQRYQREQDKKQKEKEAKRGELVEIAKSNYEPKSMAGASKGTPMSREKADGGSVNPKLGESKGYRINCQSCVVVYEARLRGYDVETLPNTSGSKLEKLSLKPQDAWIDMSTGEPAEPESLDSSSVASLYKKLNSKIDTDKRYVLRMKWKRGRCGHIVSIGKDNKGMYIYDPQTGKTFYEKEMLVGYLRDIALKGLYNAPWLLRVDDKAFNPEYYNSIMKKA